MPEQHFSPLIFSGTYVGSVEEPDWTLMDVVSESHDRVFERFIRFDQRYSSKPIVHVSLAGFDIDNSRNARLSLNATNITNEGFSLQIRTWLNTRMWSVEVTWLSIGVA